LADVGFVWNEVVGEASDFKNKGVVEGFSGAIDEVVEDLAAPVQGLAVGVSTGQPEKGGDQGGGKTNSSGGRKFLALGVR
jgi:hypothetical protein